MKMNQKAVSSVVIAILVIAVVGVVAVSAAYVYLSDDDSDGMIVDGVGRKVNVGSSDKIASTSATVTEIICGLGGYSKIAGVSNDVNPYTVQEYVMGIPNDGYPNSILNGLSNNTIKDLGQMWEMSAEAMLLCDPDLIIMGGYFNKDSTISQLEEMGKPVIICKDDNSLENIYFNIELIGKVIGKESEAKTLIDQMKSAIGKVVDWTKSLDVDSPNVAVFMYYGSSYGTYACGSNYLLGTPIIGMLGGTNAFPNITANSGKYDIVNTEAVVVANPDVVIDATPSSAADLNSIKTNSVTKNIPAAVNDRVYGTFDSCSSAFSMATQGFVNSIAMMAMFMYEDQLDFEIDHFVGDNYANSLKLFWEQINA